MKERLTKQCLTKPSILLALLTTNAVCEWNFNFLSIIIPRSFSSDTSFNKLPSIVFETIFQESMIHHLIITTLFPVTNMKTWDLKDPRVKVYINLERLNRGASTTVDVILQMDSGSQLQ